MTASVEKNQTKQMFNNVDLLMGRNMTMHDFSAKTRTLFKEMNEQLFAKDQYVLPSGKLKIHVIYPRNTGVEYGYARLDPTA